MSLEDELRAIVREELIAALEPRISTPKMISPAELVERTGLSLSTVHRMIRSNKITVHRVGRRLLIPAAQVDELGKQ